MRTTAFIEGDRVVAQQGIRQAGAVQPAGASGVVVRVKQVGLSIASFVEYTVAWDSGIESTVVNGHILLSKEVR